MLSIWNALIQCTSPNRQIEYSYERKPREIAAPEVIARRAVTLLKIAPGNDVRPELTDEGLDLLTSLGDGPVHVLVFVGSSRCGQSTTCSEFLQTPREITYFNMGHDKEQVTVGVDAIAIKHPNAPGSLLVIDCENTDNPFAADSAHHTILAMLSFAVAFHVVSCEYGQLRESTLEDLAAVGASWHAITGTGREAQRKPDLTLLVINSRFRSWQDTCARIFDNPTCTDSHRLAVRKALSTVFGNKQFHALPTIGSPQYQDSIQQLRDLLLKRDAAHTNDADNHGLLSGRELARMLQRLCAEVAQRGGIKENERSFAKVVRKVNDLRQRTMSEDGCIKMSNELQVQMMTGAKRVIMFTLEPLKKQVKEVCRKFQQKYDSEEHYHVLTRTIGNDVYVISSQNQLMLLPEGSDLGLRRSTELVRVRLNAVRNAESIKVVSALTHLLPTLCADPICAVHAIQGDGLRIILEASKLGSDALEASMVCLCVLLQYDAALEWFQYNPDGMGPEFFCRLYDIILPNGDMDMVRASWPYASLAVCLFMLQAFSKITALAAHKAARGHGRFEPAYPRLVDAAINEDTTDFQASAGSMILCALMGAARSNPKLLDKISAQILQSTTDQDAVGALFVEDQRRGRLAKDLVMLLMSACGEISSGGSARAAELQFVERELHHVNAKMQKLQEVNEALKEDLRRHHTVMCNLLPLLQTEEHPIVAKGLKKIIGHGWESIKWKKGYTLLHMAADQLEDPMLIKLLGSLTPDIDEQDDDGFRPIDYARQNPCADVLATVECLRKKRQNAAPEELDLTLQPVETVEFDCRGSKQPSVRRLRTVTMCSEGMEQDDEEEVFDFDHEDIRSMDKHDLQKMMLYTRAENIRLLEENARLLAEAQAAAMGAAAVSPNDPMNGKEVVTPRFAPQSTPLEASTNGTLSTPKSQSPQVAEESEIGTAGKSTEPGTAGKSTEPYIAEKYTPCPADPMFETSAAKPLCDTRSSQPPEQAPEIANCIDKAPGPGLPEASTLPLESDPGVAPPPSLPHALPADPESQCNSAKTKPDLDAWQPPEQAPEVVQHMDDKPVPRVPELGAVPPTEADPENTTPRENLQRRRGAVTDATQAFTAINKSPRKEDANNLQEEAVAIGTAEMLEGAPPEVFKDTAAEGKAAAKTKGKGKVKGKGKPANQLLSEVTPGKLDTQTKEAVAADPKTPDATAPTSETKASAGKSLGTPGGKGKAPGPPSGKGPGPPAPAGKASPGSAVGKGVGGKGKSVAEPTKPVVKPSVPMKSLQWTRFIAGQQLKQGETIWDNVQNKPDLVPLQEIEERFGRVVKVKVQKQKVVEKKKAKELKIMESGQERMPFELAALGLPPADQLAMSIIELDEEAIPTEMMPEVAKWFCPDGSRLALLQQKRSEEPSLPWAVPEYYMWVLGHIPCCGLRLHVWEFVRSLPERIQICIENVEMFEKMVDCFRESHTLPLLLEVLLAIGNYLNGGTRLGQADGFNVEALAIFDSVRDQDGKDVRHLAFDVWFNRFSDQALQLARDLEPLFANISRAIIKDPDQGDVLDKSVRVTIENMDQMVSALQRELKAKKTMLQEVLAQGGDPADSFRLQMPKLFEKAKDSVHNLVEGKDRVVSKYSALLAWFRAKDIKSKEWCLIWDDLLIPSSLIAKKDERFKKNVLIPSFCRGKPLDLQSLRALWDLENSRLQLQKQPQEECPTSDQSPSAHAQQEASPQPEFSHKPRRSLRPTLTLDDPIPVAF